MPLFGRKKDVGKTLAEVQAEELAREVHLVDEIRRHMSPGEELVLGGPSRCPRCGTLGFVESVNHQRGNCFNFCHGCRNRWVVTKRAIEESMKYPIDTTIDTTAARQRASATSNPWSDDGFVELGDGLAIEATPAIESQLAAKLDPWKVRPPARTDSGTSSRS